MYKKLLYQCVEGFFSFIYFFFQTSNQCYLGTRVATQKRTQDARKVIPEFTYKEQGNEDCGIGVEGPSLPFIPMLIFFYDSKACGKIHRPGNQTLVMSQKAQIPLPNHVLPPHSFLTWFYYRKHCQTLSRQTNNNQTVVSIHLQKMQTRSFEGQRFWIFFFFNDDDFTWSSLRKILKTNNWRNDTASHFNQLCTTHIWKKESRLRLYLSEEVSTVNNELY